VCTCVCVSASVWQHDPRVEHTRESILSPHSISLYTPHISLYASFVALLKVDYHDPSVVSPRGVTALQQAGAKSFDKREARKVDEGSAASPADRDKSPICDSRVARGKVLVRLVLLRAWRRLAPVQSVDSPPLAATAQVAGNGRRSAEPEVVGDADAAVMQEKVAQAVAQVLSKGSITGTSNGALSARSRPDLAGGSGDGRRSTGRTPPKTPRGGVGEGVTDGALSARGRPDLAGGSRDGRRPTGRTPPRTPRGGVGGVGPGRGLLTGHKGSPPEPGAPIPQLGFVTCTRVHAAAHVCAWRWRMCVQCMEGGAQVRAVGTGAVVALITMRVVCFHSVFCSLHVAVWHSCFGLDVCRWGEPSPHTHRGGSADGKDAGMGVTVVSGSSWIALRHAVPDP